MAVYLQYILRHTESLLHFGLGVYSHVPETNNFWYKIWIASSNTPKVKCNANLIIDHIALAKQVANRIGCVCMSIHLPVCKSVSERKEQQPP